MWGNYGAKHISILAQSFGIEVNPHVWGLHVLQSVNPFQKIKNKHKDCLFARQPILEYDQSDHPFRKRTLKTPIKNNKWIRSCSNYFSLN